MIKYVFLVLLFLNLACSTSQTKRQCQELDWLKVGLGQAFEGIDYEEGFAYYYATCSLKHNISIDKKQFQLGHQYGLEQFCDQSNATIWGLQGKKYNGICPKNKEKRFLASYSKGYNQYLVNQVENLNGTISSLEEEINKLKRELALKNSPINAASRPKHVYHADL